MPVRQAHQLHNPKFCTEFILETLVTTKRAVPVTVLVAACVAWFDHSSPGHSATQNPSGPPWTAEAQAPSSYSYRMQFDSRESSAVFIGEPRGAHVRFG